MTDAEVMIRRQNKDGLIIIYIQHESAAFIGLFHLVGAATCGELPELSETDAERSTSPLCSGE